MLPPRVGGDGLQSAQLNLAEGRNAGAGLYHRWFAGVEGEPTGDAYGLAIHL